MKRTLSVLTLSLLADAHAQNAFVPPFDHHALSKGEGKWLAAIVTGIEFLSVLGERSQIVDLR